MSDNRTEIVAPDQFTTTLIVEQSLTQVNVTESRITVRHNGGPQGPAGPGVPTGGTTGQYLVKASNTNFDTAWMPLGGGISHTSLSDIGTNTHAQIDTALASLPGTYVAKSGDIMTGPLTLESVDAVIQNLVVKNTDLTLDVSAGTRNVITAMGDSISSMTLAGRMNIISGFVSGGAVINAPSDNSLVVAQISGSNVSIEASQPGTFVRGFIAADNCGMSAGAFAATATGYIGSATGSSITAGGFVSDASGYIADSSTSGTISALGEVSTARGKVYDASSSLNASGEVSYAHGISKDGGTISSTSESSHVSGYSNGPGATLQATAVGSYTRGYVYGQGARLESIGTGSVSFGMVTDQNARATSSGESSFLFARVQDSDSFVEASGKAAAIFGVAMGGASMTATERASFINGVSDGSGSSISSQGAATFINASVRNGGTVTVSGEGSGFFGVENGTNTSISGTASFGFGINLNINNDQAFVFGSGITAFGDKSATYGWDGVRSVVIDSAGLNLPLQAGSTGMAYFDTSGNFFSAGSTIEYHNTKRASWSYHYNSYASNWTAVLGEGFNTYVGTGGHTCLLPNVAGDEGVRITIKHQGSGILTVGTSGSSLFLLDGFPSVALFRGQSVTCVWNGGSWSVVDVNERKIYSAKLATYTVQPSDRFIEATANTFTITLHTAASYRDAEYEFFNSGSGVVTIATTSSQPIYGNGSSATTRTLNQGEYLKVRSNTTGWMITGKN